MQRSALAALRQSRRPAAHSHTVLRQFARPRQPLRHLNSTNPKTDPKSWTARFDRFEARLPAWLRRYTVSLRGAPASSIVSFLILHEITAILPVFGLAFAFHYTNWLPKSFTEGTWAGWMKSSIEKSGRMLMRRGWIKDEDLGEDASQGRITKWRMDGDVPVNGREDVVESHEENEEAKQGRLGPWRSARKQKEDVDDEGEGKSGAMKWWSERSEGMKGNAGRWWGKGENNVRWIVEFATAYAIVKVTIPFRIAGCVWAAPWFARTCILPVARVVARLGAKMG